MVYIYVMGCIATLAYGVWLMKDNDKIEGWLLLSIFFVSILSWSGLIALFVGANAKRNR